MLDKLADFTRKSSTRTWVDCWVRKRQLIRWSRCGSVKLDNGDGGVDGGDGEGFNVMGEDGDGFAMYKALWPCKYQFEKQVR